MPLNSGEPARRMKGRGRSRGDLDTLRDADGRVEKWTYAAINEHVVKWYRPPPSADGKQAQTLGNKAHINAYWERARRKFPVPSFFNFRAKDVPSSFRRVDGPGDDVEAPAPPPRKTPSSSQRLRETSWSPQNHPPANARNGSSPAQARRASPSASPTSARTAAVTPTSSTRREKTSGREAAAAAAAASSSSSSESPSPTRQRPPRQRARPSTGTVYGSSVNAEEYLRQEDPSPSLSAQPPLSPSPRTRDTHHVRHDRRDDVDEQDLRPLFRRPHKEPSVAVNSASVLCWLQIKKGFKPDEQGRGFVDPACGKVTTVPELLRRLESDALLLKEYQAWKKRPDSDAETPPQIAARSRLYDPESPAASCSPGASAEARAGRPRDVPIRNLCPISEAIGVSAGETDESDEEGWAGPGLTQMDDAVVAPPQPLSPGGTPRGARDALPIWPGEDGYAASDGAGSHAERSSSIDVGGDGDGSSDSDNHSVGLGQEHEESELNTEEASAEGYDDEEIDQGAQPEGNDGSSPSVCPEVGCGVIAPDSRGEAVPTRRTRASLRAPAVGAGRTPSSHRSTRGRSAAARISGVPKLNDVWTFLTRSKGWGYRKINGEHLVAGPDERDPPMDQRDLREYMADRPDLLEECLAWWADPEVGAVRRSKRRNSRGKGGGRGAAHERQLPETKFAFSFLREQKGWTWAKPSNGCVVAPESGAHPVAEQELPQYIADNDDLMMDYEAWREDMEAERRKGKEEQDRRKRKVTESRARKRASAAAARRRKMDEARRALQEREQRKARDKAARAAAAAAAAAAAVGHKSAPRSAPSTKKHPARRRRPEPARNGGAVGRRKVGSSKGKGKVKSSAEGVEERGAKHGFRRGGGAKCTGRNASKAAKVISSADERHAGDNEEEQEEQEGGAESCSCSSDAGADEEDRPSLGVDGGWETDSDNDEEEEGRDSEDEVRDVEGDDDGEGDNFSQRGGDQHDEIMDEDERKAMFLHNFKVEDLDPKFMWGFLRDEDGWTYASGGLRSPFVYFKKSVPRDPEREPRNLTEVREVVRSDPDLRRRFYAYYERKVVDKEAAREKKLLLHPKRQRHEGHDRDRDRDCERERDGSCEQHAAKGAGRGKTTLVEGSKADDAQGHGRRKARTGSPLRQPPSQYSSSSSSCSSSDASSRSPSPLPSDAEPGPAGRRGGSARRGNAASGGKERYKNTRQREHTLREDQGKAARGKGKQSRRARAPAPLAKATRTAGVEDASQREFLDPPAIAGGLCSVCLGPGTREDLFLQCRQHQCNTWVHKSCYPVDVRSIEKGELFLCNACAADPSDPENRGCTICRQTQGEGGYCMIPTSEGHFVHYLCYKKTMPDADSRQNFSTVAATRQYLAPTGVAEVVARMTSRRLHPCYVCERQGGVLRRCPRNECRTRFHPLCGAIAAARELEDKSKSASAGEDDDVGLGAEITILCRTHMVQAEKDCKVCAGLGTVKDMAACCRCDEHYHKRCIEPSIPADQDVSKIGWVCADCKESGGGLFPVDSAGDDDDNESSLSSEEGFADGGGVCQRSGRPAATGDTDGEDPEPPEHGSPEWRGWQQRQVQKRRPRGRGKPSPLAKNASSETRASGGRRPRKRPRQGSVQSGTTHRPRAKATRRRDGSRAEMRRVEARRRALEAMWSSCEEDADGFGTSDEEEDSEDDLDGGGHAGRQSNKARTEAFSAIPVGAQAYFNSHAGVKTLAVIAGGGGGAAQRNASAGSTLATRVLRKRGWHTRNRFSRAAKEDRLKTEAERRAGRKRARQEGSATGTGGRGAASDADREDEDDDWLAEEEEEAGAGLGAFAWEGGESRMEELLRLVQEPVCEQLDALMSKHASRFPLWKSEMDWGWSLLFYGVGSKRELLRRFEDHIGREAGEGVAIVAYEGFRGNASVRDLLDSLCQEVLGVKSPELSCPSLQEYARGFAEALERRKQRRRASARGGSAAAAAAAAAADAVGAPDREFLLPRRFGAKGNGRTGGGRADGVDHFFEAAGARSVARRIYLFVHGIDGEVFRNEESQQALAELAASDAVHLVASIDHVNAPLMWDVGLAETFNWAWHKTHTYQPYIEELRGRRGLCVEEDQVLALDRLSMVMKALTPRHVDVVVCLAKKLKSSPELGGKWLYKDLLAELKSKLSADNAQVLDGLLVELTDHHVVVDEKTGNARYLSVPGGAEVLKFLAEYGG